MAKKKMAGPVVRIACEGAAALPLDDLADMQGDMKRLTTDAYRRLKAEIADRGFSFPVACWRSPEGPRILDGHQRVEALHRMRKEGWGVPDVPVAWVDAIDEAEAMRKVLAAASQFGEFDLVSLGALLDGAGIGLDEAAERFALPVDLSLLELRSDTPPDAAVPAGAEEVGRESFTRFAHVCPRCGFRSDDPTAKQKAS
jgi:ParB-like chromosome segregation protein Spo0J